MKIIVMKNNHESITINDKDYGCVCPKCGSVFICNQSDVLIPRGISRDADITNENVIIRCPNVKCETPILFWSDCIEPLEDENARYNFIVDMMNGVKNK